MLNRLRAPDNRGREKSPHRLLANSAGTIAIQFAIALPVLVGFAALGIEMTTLFVQQKRMQRAADAAAVSAGVTGLTTAQRLAAAQAVAAENGFVNGAVDSAGTTTVNVSSPPTLGNYKANALAQEVIISRPYKLGLARLFLKSPLTVRARAVSIPGRQSTGCVMALAASGAGFVLNNGGKIANLNCEIVARSTSSNAIEMWNNTLISGPVYVSGGIDTTKGGTSAVITGAPVVTYGAALDDPYAAFPLPAIPTTCTTQTTNKGELKTPTVAVLPGRFCNGLVVTAGQSVTFTTGTYFIDGVLDFKNTSRLTATSGVTIILNSSTDVTIGSSVIWKISAPTTGTLYGRAFTSQSNVTGTVTVGNNSTLTIEGAIYLPKMDVTFNGNATTSGANCTQLIANKVTVFGTLNFAANCSLINVKQIGRTQPVLSE